MSAQLPPDALSYALAYGTQANYYGAGRLAWVCSFLPPEHPVAQARRDAIGDGYGFPPRPIWREPSAGGVNKARRPWLPL